MMVEVWQGLVDDYRTLIGVESEKIDVNNSSEIHDQEQDNA